MESRGMMSSSTTKLSTSAAAERARSSDSTGGGENAVHLTLPVKRGSRSSSSVSSTACVEMRRIMGQRRRALCGSSCQAVASTNPPTERPPAD
jgi:hypothetical protein